MFVRRGIPAGISFPKEGITPPVDLPGSELDARPISQRHTYTQTGQGAAPPPQDTKPSGISLRRVIKTPARFKNSRTSVRLRCRPVLCARCSDLCEDKLSQGSSEGNGRRNNQAAKEKTTTIKPAEDRTTTNKFLKTEEEVDYSYVAIGKSDIVDNFWKRPLAQPVPSSTKLAGPKKSKHVNGGKEGRKTATTLKSEPPMTFTPPAEDNVSIQEMYKAEDPERSMSNMGTAVVPKSSVLLARKSKRKGYPLPAVNPSKCLRFADSKKQKHKNKTVSNIIQGGEKNSAAECSSTKNELDNHIQLQEWSNRMRKKSNVPARFRDSSFPPKSHFGRHRSSEEENSPSSPETLSTDHLETLGGSTKLGSDRSHMRCNASTGSCSSNSMINSSPEDVSAGSSSNGDKVDSTKTKTPVIKITFGSSGNGVVVQIPPKNTKREMIPSDTESKSCRKAMKKAKKEARKKRLLFSESSPSNSSPTALLQSPNLAFKSGGLKKSNRAKENNLKTKDRKRRRKESGGPKNMRLMQYIQPDIFEEEKLERNFSTELDSGEECRQSTDIGESLMNPQSSIVERENKSNRVCISLKRLDSNAYIPVNKVSSTSESTQNPKGDDYGEHSRGVCSRVDSSGENLEPDDARDFHTEDDFDISLAISISAYRDGEYLETPHIYKRGEVVWGKLPGSPWWPAKVVV